MIGVLLGAAGSVWTVLEAAAATALASLGLLAGAGSLWRWVVKPRRDLAVLTDQAATDKRIAAAVESAIEPIKLELQNNGGKSFRDSVDRQFREIREHLVRQDTRLDQVFVSSYGQIRPHQSDDIDHGSPK